MHAHYTLYTHTGYTYIACKLYLNVHLTKRNKRLVAVDCLLIVWSISKQVVYEGRRRRGKSKEWAYKQKGINILHFLI